ncbi:MAG: hypothetical protein ACRDSJ_16350 [Rubrobacteraceae bacterium]
MRLWSAALGGEVFYQADLPDCCKRDARGADDEFECVSCGAKWQSGEKPEPEECAFAEKEERKGAA